MLERRFDDKKYAEEMNLEWLTPKELIELNIMSRFKNINSRTPILTTLIYISPEKM